MMPFDGRKGKGKKVKFHTVEKEFVIPTPYQIAENVFKQILDVGFSKVERVSPSDANCIIRVFQTLHYKYEFDITFNMYGADCFTNDALGWVSNTSNEMFLF